MRFLQIPVDSHDDRHDSESVADPSVESPFRAAIDPTIDEAPGDWKP